MRNDFSEETRLLFLYNWECWVCGQNHWNALHHIMGRGFGNSKLETSPLNAAPVNNANCHIDKGFTEEDKKRMLQKTLKFLLRNGYRLTEKDVLFYKKYQHYYKGGEK